MAAERRAIRILPPELADQIAAGEVVERPSSVVKELVENSLDSGATRIRVEIERGGQAKICVFDNGSGMEPDELSLAVTRHATSKIGHLRDLSRIESFGFRGEALASIGSVSTLTVTSCAAGAGEGARISVDRGVAAGAEPAALDAGTQIEVRDLFANVPARLKFLKTEATEARRCQEVLARMALANLGVGFVLVSNEKTVFRFPPDQSLKQRLRELWPAEMAEACLEVAGEGPAGRISGLTGAPSQAQARTERMYFYVNSRPVQDRTLTAAVREAYKGRLLAREHPQCALFLSLPPEEVDVNVHPAKSEVRFRDERGVFSLVRRAVLSALEGLAEAGYPQRKAVDAPSFAERAASSAKSVSPGAGKFPSYAEFRRTPPSGPRPASQARLATEPSPAPLPEKGLLRPETAEPSGPAPVAGGFEYLGQVESGYLVLRDARGGLNLLDQHAAHERVLHSALKVAASRGESRPLALPLEMVLHKSQAARLEEIFAELAGLGFAMSRPEPLKLEITAVPPSLTPGRAREYLADALSGKSSSLDELLAMLACKAAVKAGEDLAREEALSLIESWAASEGRDYCPHGRPAVVRLSLRDLEKLFKRTG